MHTILTELAAKEQALCTYTSSLTGTLEARTQQLKKAGIFTAYNEIYATYLAAYQNSIEESQRLEVLKRLTFLSWFSMSEPSFISGIGELSAAAIRTTYELLDGYVQGQKLDVELHWMLSFYSSWDFLLLPFIEPQLPALAAFIKAADHAALHVPKRPSSWQTMDNRGQMGLYWQSIRVDMP